METEIDIPKRQETPPNINNGETAEQEVDTYANGPAKRKREAEEGMEVDGYQHAAKKIAKMPGAPESNHGNPIVLEEDTGAILIDDD